MTNWKSPPSDNPNLVYNFFPYILLLLFHFISGFSTTSAHSHTHTHTHTHTRQSTYTHAARFLSLASGGASSPEKDKTGGSEKSLSLSLWLYRREGNSRGRLDWGSRGDLYIRKSTDFSKSCARKAVGTPHSEKYNNNDNNAYTTSEFSFAKMTKLKRRAGC